MNEILVAVLVSAVVSSTITVILTRRIAAYHFKVIDGYVKDMVESAKEQIRKAYIGNREKHQRSNQVSQMINTNFSCDKQVEVTYETD